MDHGGNIYRFAQHIGCHPEQVIDFSANINPEQAVDFNCLQAVQLGPYEDPDYGLLKEAIKVRYPYPAGVDIEVFNGASAAIFALLKHLHPQELVLYAPLYGEYARLAEQLGCNLHHIDRFESLTSPVPKNSTVIFVNPSTPDGQLYDMQVLLKQWQMDDCTIIVDESFLDFCIADSVVEYIDKYDKLYVIKSLSKFYGCAGIRIGFMSATAQAIKALKRLEPAWKLSSFDMAYIQQALADKIFIEQTRKQTAYRRDLLRHALQTSGLFMRIYSGEANFLLTKLANNGDGHQLQSRLVSSRILIRVCDNFVGLDKSYVRFAVKNETAILKLSSALNNVAL
ncbi:aminotransferase class I/II-fold pyridoxal phosphate-dependent enzyme [Methylobacter sp. S3L5C]|uniref:aminotransferase class I/II-fold pyridoxal phosphate-dependent enzyme n=1 Tax=Methylobacter sp. S3L5C TaxID=2839024 RepID=UPI001FAD035E|nr:aminotransferase class I/II-fold pyridoxal phosphate-dependent enzyme [Methylobacter sp. S3L5C]UOA07097.1 aminotransferase class I/II-fold pyridoxal phosphate-dependent enzyme [Methylobacter sp. S3L5C]